MKTTCKHCGIVNKPHKCPHKKYINNNREDKEVYKDKRWKKLRAEVLKDYDYVCVWSLYVDGNIKVADRGHHIKEVLECPELAFEYDNVSPLCSHNHDVVHNLYKVDKETVQELLRQMLKDYKSGDKCRCKYKKNIEKILKSPPVL